MFTNACAFAIIFQFLEPFSAVPAKAPNNFDVACKFMSLYLTLISSFFLSINSKTSASPSPFFRACSNNNLPCSLNASNSLLRPISFNIEISLIPAILILFRSWCIFVCPRIISVSFCFKVISVAFAFASFCCACKLSAFVLNSASAFSLTASAIFFSWSNKSNC